MSDSRKDAVDLLTEDHRDVEALFGRLESGGGSNEDRQQLVNVVIAELVRHSIAEEQYLYPATREVLDDGDEIADHEIEEHAEAEQTMKELESLTPDDAAFDQKLGSLISDIRHHVEDEENDLFPRLRRECSGEALADLGQKIQAAKDSAPTRPHPSAPDTPPANQILAPGAGLVDRVRDALSGRATTPDDL